MVKNLPAVQEIWAQPMENGMAAHSSILAWRNPWTEEPGISKTNTHTHNIQFNHNQGGFNLDNSIGIKILVVFLKN